MSYTAAPSPLGTNYERLYLTSQRPRMAHDADPRNQAFRAGQDRSRGGRDRRRLGRDDDNLLSDRLDQLQSHLQNAITDPDDLSQANELLSQLLEAIRRRGRRLERPRGAAQGSRSLLEGSPRGDRRQAV
jgi:hypothetical protein